MFEFLWSSDLEDKEIDYSDRQVSYVVEQQALIQYTPRRACSVGMVQRDYGFP